MSAFSDLSNDIAVHIASRPCSFRDLPALAGSVLSLSSAAQCAVDMMRNMLVAEDDDKDEDDDPDGAQLAFNRCSDIVKVLSPEDRLAFISSMADLVRPSEWEQTLGVDAIGPALVALNGRAIVPVVVVMLAAAFGESSVLVYMLGDVGKAGEDEEEGGVGWAFDVGPRFCPIFFACQRGHCSTVATLLDLGADSCYFDCGEYSPILAATSGDVVDLLLERGHISSSSVIDILLHGAIDIDEGLVWRLVEGHNPSEEGLTAVLRWAIDSRSPTSIRRLHAHTRNTPFSIAGPSPSTAFSKAAVLPTATSLPGQ